MTDRRSLNLKLIFSVLAAFLLSLAFSWFLHDRLSERDAYALIDRTFDNVQDELADYAKRIKPDMTDAETDEIYEKALVRMKGLKYEIDRLRRDYLARKMTE